MRCVPVAEIGPSSALMSVEGLKKIRKLAVSIATEFEEEGMAR
ncbi:hypothetical protein [Microvirga massiliensis]|nr:hypothetical protein [Microvirga massiliensis]